MDTTLNIAFIGGGNMATALAAGLAGHACPAGNLHVIDHSEAARAAWQGRGASAAGEPDAELRRCNVWIFAVKPQNMREVVLACRPWLGSDTLVISVAAGLSADTLAGWLGESGRPWDRLVRCMPNTPALIGAGVTALMALGGVDAQGRELAQSLLASVGQTVWVDSDDQLDAVTALSGSGPAYVFLFLESLVSGGQALGLDAETALSLALGTLSGATKLAASSDDTLEVLRQKVTSKGGTTAAALGVFEQNGLRATVAQAMQAAYQRAGELAAEFGKN